MSLAGRISLGRPDRIGSAVEQISTVVPERFWIMLKVYADESGTHDALGVQPGSDVVGIVGYAAWDEDWRRIEKHWATRLRKFGVKEFHMRSFMRDKEYPYRNWPDRKREKFINALIKIARDNTRFGIGGLVVLEDYNRIVPDFLRDERKHPYHFTFQMFFDLILPQLEKFDPPLPKGHQVAFIFEQNQQFEADAIKAFHAIKGLRDKHDRMGSIDFFPKKRCPLFQIADLIVYLVRDDLSRKIRGEKRRSWIDDIRQRENLLIGYYDKGNLPKYVRGVIEGKIKALNAAGVKCP